MAGLGIFNQKKCDRRGHARRAPESLTDKSKAVVFLTRFLYRSYTQKKLFLGPQWGLWWYYRSLALFAMRALALFV